MIGPPGPTLKRPRSAGRLRPRAGWSRPPSARTPDGPTPARSGASTSGSTTANLDDVALAAYLAELHDAGRASSSASMAVAAACFLAKLAGQPTPAGERTARVLAGYRRTAGDRGRGQARPFGVSDLAAVLATCHRPRRRGRGISSPDVVDTTDGDGVLVTVRRSKTNQEGEMNDVRFVKGRRRARHPHAPDCHEPGAGRSWWCPLSAQMIGLRFTASVRSIFLVAHRSFNSAQTLCSRVCGTQRIGVPPVRRRVAGRGSPRAAYQ